MRSPPERIVKHDLRLDILCCLVDGEPLTVGQLSARTGKSRTEVSYHLKLLNSHDLVGATGKMSAHEPLYAATLDEHDEWVRKAVMSHRSD
jgi:DNA-binding transcriptional ArsR family regulator